MGAVFRARDRRHARDVALKVVSPELAGDPVFEERFDREARTLGQLDHPNIVRVFDSGRRGPWLFLVMEYVDGVDLRRWMDLGDFDADAALRLLPALCEALRHAHERGVVHRDVKPENILIDQSGAVKLADFGLAKLAGEADWGVTRTNQALGTLHYMAPEQLEGASSVDHRADIFSLGVVVYEMLTGQLPHGRFELPSQKQPSLRGVDRAVLRSMERDPSKRYQSATEFERDVLAGRGQRKSLRRDVEAPGAQQGAAGPGWQLLGWIGAVVSAAGFVVMCLGFASGYGLLPRGVPEGLTIMVAGMGCGLYALTKAPAKTRYGWRLAAAFAACVPIGVILFLATVLVGGSVLRLSCCMDFPCFVLACAGTLAWMFGVASSGNLIWFKPGPEQARRR